MRDLPAHHLHESGPDCAVIDYRICSSFAYQLCGYADAAACAQKQRVPSSPQSLREYASLLHPHLAVQIGAHLLEGNLDAAAQAALELLRDLSTNLPEDRRDESGAPIDLRTHYLRRLVSGTLAYFNDSAAQQGYNLQIVAMVNQALGVAEPEAVSVRDLGDPKTDKMVLLAVTHEIIRRVERDSLHVEKMLKSPRPERPSRDTPPVLETPESD